MKAAAVVGPRTVEIAVEGVPRPGWARRVPAFCARALEAAGAGRWDLSILLCDDGRMRELNGRYRGRDRTTDVLSFPRSDAPEDELPPPLEGGFVAGDIAISLPTMRANARGNGATEGEELKRLLVHGILHLAGMDHGRGKGRRMLGLQERLLGDLEAETIIRE